MNGNETASMAGCENPLSLSPEAAACLQRLPFKDCTLVLSDGKISCHRCKLAEVSEVLENMLQDLSPASEVLLPEEDMASIAPMLQVAYGAANVKVDALNLKVVLHGYYEYACPALETAAKRWMVDSASCMGTFGNPELLDLLQIATSFKMESVRKYCLNAAAGNMFKGPGAEKLTGLDPSDLTALLTQQAVLAESRTQQEVSSSVALNVKSGTRPKNQGRS